MRAEQLLAKKGFDIDEKIDIVAEPDRRQAMVEETATASLGRLDDAISELEEAVAINPDHREAHTNLAIIYHFTKQLDKARAHFKRAEELGYRFHQETGEALKKATPKRRP